MYVFLNDCYDAIEYYQLANEALQDFKKTREETYVYKHLNYRQLAHNTIKERRIDLFTCFLDYQYRIIEFNK
jgi:hypothetical protein